MRASWRRPGEKHTGSERANERSRQRGRKKRGREPGNTRTLMKCLNTKKKVVPEKGAVEGHK